MLPVSEGVVRAERPVIPFAPVRVIGGLHDGVVTARHQALNITNQIYVVSKSWLDSANKQTFDTKGEILNSFGHFCILKKV